MLKKAYVEFTNRCNLACSFCPGTRRKSAFMTAEDFSRVLRRLQGITEHIYLHVMGEPLLHPELPTILALAGEAGYNVYITTNGTLLGEKGAVLLSAPAVRVISSTRLTAAMAANASPRKPRVPMASRSYSVRILLVAWRRKAVRQSSASMPLPSSVTRI